uniref:Uncharacterized protein n=1 Tax=Psilocybe cubensis TaxID=181762 RepID=A0A8H8CGX8_PSICU
MADLLQPHIFRSVTLCIHGDNYQQGVEKLEALARSTHPACYAARALTIRTLSPGYAPRSFGPIALLKANNSIDLFEKDPFEVSTAKDRIINHLLDAITSLQGVRAVQWVPNLHDGKQVHQIVMSSLKYLPSLSCLQIHFIEFEIPLELDSLRGLQDLIILTEKCSPQWEDEILDNVAKAVVCNPNLSSLELITAINPDKGDITNDSARFTNLLKYFPISIPPLRLRHLKLASYIPILTEPFMLHLACLTSLSLTKLDESRLDVIWKYFTTAEIHLTALCVDHVSHCFLNYLSSYSGLKKLYLEPDRLGYSNLSDEMAVVFYDGCLDNHVQSLHDLQIKPAYEGLWCIGFHNYDCISKLTALQHLAMSIFSSPDDKGGYDGAFPPIENAVRDILNMVISYTPNIKDLVLYPSVPESYRWLICGGNSIKHRQFVCNKFVHCAKNYVAPPSCTRIPSLTVGSGTAKTVLVGEHLSQTSGSAAMRYVDGIPKEQR